MTILKALLLFIFALNLSEHRVSSVSLPNTIKGLKTTYEILAKGEEGSDAVTKGSKVTVHATGTVKETGKKFWSTKDKGQSPFEYTAGVGGVITGWRRRRDRLETAWSDAGGIPKQRELHKAKGSSWWSTAAPQRPQIDKVAMVLDAVLALKPGDEDGELQQPTESV
eukprot:gene4717-5770_t